MRPHFTSRFMARRLPQAFHFATLFVFSLLAMGLSSPVSASTSLHDRVQRAVWKIHNKNSQATAIAISPVYALANAHVVKGLLKGRNTIGVFLSQKAGMADRSTRHPRAWFVPRPSKPLGC